MYLTKKNFELEFNQLDWPVFKYVELYDILRHCLPQEGYHISFYIYILFEE